MSILSLYAVKNSDGQWLRARGYGGGGKSWVDSIEGARLYGKLSPARARVTFFAANYPDYPPPTIVKLLVTEVVELDESERVTKTLAKRATAAENYEVNEKKRELEHAERALANAKARLSRARS